MILYFDSLITDVPLPGRNRNLLKEDIRKNSGIYKMPKKIDIAKYSLASYSIIPWSYVLIKYELEDKKKYKEFDEYIKNLFPKAKIIHKRSDTQSEIKKAFSFIERVNDNWIFYAPNNDHPLISQDPLIYKYIKKLISVAETIEKQNKYVSIMYSHFSEFLNIPIKGNIANLIHGSDIKLIKNNKEYIEYVKESGDFSSVQIVNKSLFKDWFLSNKIKGRIIRAEDVKDQSSIKNQIIIAPKKEICAHFDGYEHMLGTPIEISIDKIPPLFIPPGFFESNIKISYGFNDYRKGWVNINPTAQNHIFRDGKKGTDMKITLDNIPFFWKKRISKIDINKSANQNLLNLKAMELDGYKKDPWSVKTPGISYESFSYWLRITKFILNIKLRSFVSKIRKEFFR